MNTIFSQIEQKFNQFSLREKVLSTAMVLVVLYGGWQSILYDPLLSSSVDISKKAEDMKQKISLLEKEVDTVSQALGRDPMASLVAQVKALKAENQSLDKTILQKFEKMVSSTEMTDLLSKLAQKTSAISVEGAKVRSIESTDTKALFPAKSFEMNGQMKSFQIFEHGVRLEMEGGYFEMLNLLKSMESLHPDIVWDELSYEVKEYPHARMVVLFHTLSLEEGWIGV